MAMQKAKTNYKKTYDNKDYRPWYDEAKQYNTISTNQSKSLLTNQKSNIKNQKSTMNFQTIVQNNVKKYGASDKLFYLNDFQQNFTVARTRQKIQLKDISHQKDEELIEKYYENQQSMSELTGLFQYYKYYINNSIIFEKQHFKILYNYYQKKKYLQYKRLKNVLNLSNDHNDNSSNSLVNQNISLNNLRQSHASTSKTFYIMNALKDTSFNNNESQHQKSQSLAFMELNKKLHQIINQKFRQQKFKKSNKLFQKQIGFFEEEKIKLTNKKNQVTKKQNHYKQSLQNSHSSMKRTKLTKNIKQFSPFQSNQHTISSKHLKIAHQPFILKGHKNRNKSNLSMGQLDNQYQNIITKVSPFKNEKKRLNSCETIVNNITSKDKITDKKTKNHFKTIDKVINLKSEQFHLPDFQQFLKKSKFISSKQKKIDEATLTSSKKQRKQNSPEPLMSQLRMKRPKKKKNKSQSQSGKISFQKSPEKNNNKNIQIEQNINNLKKKIKLAKQTLKMSSGTVSSALRKQKPK